MIVFELFNPKYHDKKAAAVVVNVSNYDQINHQWMGNNTNMDVYTFYHEDAKSKRNSVTTQRFATGRTSSHWITEVQASIPSYKESVSPLTRQAKAVATSSSPVSSATPTP